jgi:RecA-family ATPase
LRQNGHSPSKCAELQSCFIEALGRYGVEAQVANRVILRPRQKVTPSSDDLASWLAQPAPESLQELLDFDTSNDPDALINKERRFLCRGGSFLLAAPSGIGKSVFVVQMAVTWALGKSFFGLQAANPLKGLLIQAENDRGDLAQMLQGVKDGLKLDQEQMSILKGNLAIYSRPHHEKGGSFCTLLERLITAHSPDVVFVDPLFAFIEGDLNSQELGSSVFRRQIDPILRRHRCILVSVHHTPKPSRERPRRRAYDFSYVGFGCASAKPRFIVDLGLTDDHTG